MAVHYEVAAGKTFMIAGPANVTVKGGEFPAVVDTLQDAKDQAPVVVSIDPATAESGAEDFTLKVTGSNFTAQSVIIFGTMDEPTTLNEDGTLSTGVKPSLFAPAVVPVSVRNGPLHSSAVDFTFAEAAPPEGEVTAKKRRS
jgi:IPT/TIG domain